MQGGNWNNGVHCGPRTVNVNNYPWNRNTNIGGRLACDYSLSCYDKEEALIKVIASVAFSKESSDRLSSPYGLTANMGKVR
jgi:hypothetical protein